MFHSAKKLLSLFGFKEGDSSKKLIKKIREAVSLWTEHKDMPIDELDLSVADQMKKVKYAWMQLKREELTSTETKLMADEMNDTLQWYQSKGYKIR